MMPRLLVLMSAYNGAAYIREQIDSILEQEGDFSLTLRVRDDGSEDETPEILAEYAARFPDKVEVMAGKNLGYNASFFTLLDSADDWDYCAFADQDDVWMPGKLAAALQCLEQAEGPALYACRSVTTDAALKPLGMTRDKKLPLKPANTLIQNICPGHNQVLNRALMELARRPRDVSQIYVYDLWIANLAALKGQILFDSRPHTYYRQHSGNELGTGSSSLGKLLKAGKRSLAGEGRKNITQMAYFVAQYQQELEAAGLYEPARRMTEADSFGKRLKALGHCPFYRQSRLETLAFKLAFLFGKY